MPVPMLKKLAAKTGKGEGKKFSTEEVEQIWADSKKEMIDSGKNPDDDYFYPYLVTVVKRKIGLKEKYIFLDKFTQFL